MATETLYEMSDRIKAEDDAFFKEAFKGMNLPADIKQAAMRIVQAYGIRGICDPGYIANIIALETRRGDGMSNFTA